MKRTVIFSLAGVVLVSFLLRLVVSLVANDIIDIQNYDTVARIVLSKGALPGLYAQTQGIYPYPPLWVWLELLAHGLATLYPIRFGLWIRLPVILADCGIVALLWNIGYKHSLRRATLFSLLYGLNPISVIITGLHGQFDALLVLFTLLSIYLLIWTQRVHWSALALSIAIAWKSFPALFIIPCILDLPQLRRKLGFAILAMLPVALLLLPFALNSYQAVIRELLGYRGVALLGLMVPLRLIYVPIVGSSFPLDTTLQILGWSGALFAVLYAIQVVWVMPRQDLLARMILTLALFYSAYAGISPQYLVWVIPFLIVDYERFPSLFWLYTAAGMLALIGFYSYAIPSTLLLNVAAGSSWSKIVYGLGGTAWWLSCLLIVLRHLSLRSEQPRLAPEPVT